MADIQPFADEAEVTSVGSLTVENRTDRVTMYGSVDLTRDREGLARARELAALLARVVRALEADEALPKQVAPPRAPTKVRNPFA
jgi:hypothetical protein